jgi:hypothetical protein
MKFKPTRNKNRNGSGVGQNPGISKPKAKDPGLSPWLKIYEDSETREDEWMGELCAPQSLPLSTRRKR